MNVEHKALIILYHSDFSLRNVRCNKMEINFCKSRLMDSIWEENCCEYCLVYGQLRFKKEKKWIESRKKV